jgi:hypothetical protein
MDALCRLDHLEHHSHPLSSGFGLSGSVIALGHPSLLVADLLIIIVRFETTIAQP